MRRDTQIGIILGVVILVVIGIFLSTRTTVYETKTPDLKISEEEIVAESEIEEIVERFASQKKAKLHLRKVLP